MSLGNGTHLLPECLVIDLFLVPLILLLPFPVFLRVVVSVEATLIVVRDGFPLRFRLRLRLRLRRRCRSSLFLRIRGLLRGFW